MFVDIAILNLVYCLNLDFFLVKQIFKIEKRKERKKKILKKFTYR